MPTPSFLEKFMGDAEIMSDLKEQVEETIKKVQEVVDLFYQQNDKAAFEKFESAIANITMTVDKLYLYRKEHPDFEISEDNIYKILKDAMDALETGDNVLMADILQYDFIGCIDEILGQIG